MNSYELALQKVLLGKELAKQAKIELYGLHYHTDFMILLLRDMTLQAIEYGITYESFAYDEETLECLESRLSHMNYFYGGSSNNSSSSNCCN